MDFSVPISSICQLVMDKYEEDPEFQPRDPDESFIEDPWGIPEAEITVKLLRRRKDIREALDQGLKEAFPDKFSEEDEIPDETIVDMMNMDTDVKTTLMELLLELTDCAEAEGETAYYPSITEYNCVEEILRIDRLTGFRESREAIPYKYEHLTTETLSLIYSNPHILPMISKMKKEQITDGLVKTALGLAKK
jgi:hypothetical protein